MTVFCYAQTENDPPPCTAVSYLFTYLLPDGHPGTRQATRSGTRVTDYPIMAALVWWDTEMA